MLQKKMWASLLLVVFVLVSCSGGVSPEELAATYVAQTNEAAQALNSAAETQIAAGVAKTQGAIATEIGANAPTATNIPTQTPRPTATPNAMQLREQDMIAQVEELFADGYLKTTQGRYRVIPDFNESWAQINWFLLYPTRFYPSDFVIRAHVQWNSASTTADIAGCGFVFREEDGNHYLALYATDGYVYILRVHNGSIIDLGRAYYGVLDYQSGEADIMMVVEGQMIVFYVNNKRVLSTQDHALRHGNLAFTILSGTNKNFGTQCTMTEIDLWMIWGTEAPEGGPSSEG
ncbi:hypothetical protein ACFLYP_02875 [Chloroflexota bacterium]